jgi:hypothetical protein
MFDDRFIGEIPQPQKDHPRFHWFCPKPTVRILFYTDDPAVQLNNVSGFGVGMLRDLIIAENPFYADFDIDLVNRHAGGHAGDKVTPALLAGYDQVWFFGVRQCNVTGQPENELTAAEVSALAAWMNTGGVLITGDHSNPRPGGADPGLDASLNLGRALGRSIPRAGELRVWDGGPDASTVDNHNTQVPVAGTDPNDLGLQSDTLPQQLILRHYSLGWSFPPWRRRWRPHPLFCGGGGPITVFPDHMHEGELVIPTSLPAATWPSGIFGQPRPEVVARGTDKRNGEVYGVVSAYDGAPAGVGRIVADATWHHYFNVNLLGFPPGPVLDDLAEFYVNLAVWLSPPAKRRAMRCHVWWWLAHNPTVTMAFGHPISILGLNAYNVLGQVATQCAMSELIWPFPLPVEMRERYPWPPEELVLGGILHQYLEAFERADAGEDAPGAEALVERGLRQALSVHLDDLRTALKSAEEIDDILKEGLRFEREGGEPSGA